MQQNDISSIRVIHFEHCRLVDSGRQVVCEASSSDRLMFQGSVETLELPCLPFTVDEVSFLDALEAHSTGSLVILHTVQCTVTLWISDSR